MEVMLVSWASNEGNVGKLGNGVMLVSCMGIGVTVGNGGNANKLSN